MKKSRLLGALCACLYTISSNANAIIVDNGTYTTINGVDWLDLSETANMSYLEVSAQLVPGGALEGWSYATAEQLSEMWIAFGGDPAYFSGWSTQNNGLFDEMAPLLGDLYCATTGCTPGDGYTNFITAEANPTLPGHLHSIVYDDINDFQSATQDYAYLSETAYWHDADKSLVVGSALIRPSAVPLPTPIWLLGSGLLGLVGMARRKKTA